MPMLIRSACLQGYVSLARSAGLDPYQLLEEVGIYRAWIDQPDIKFSTYLFRELIERSVQASGWPDFGLRLAESRTLSGLGPLALLVREQATMRHALQTMIAHSRVHTESLMLRMEALGDGTAVRLSTVASTRRPSYSLVELSIGTLHRVISQLMPGHVRPLSVNFLHPRQAELTRYRQFFSSPVHFDSEFDGLVYANTVLDEPRAVDPVLERYARDMVSQLPDVAAPAMADDVKALILSLLGQGHCSLQQICDLLGMNERTVRRRLHREGCSYEEILNQVREELVREYVGTAHRSMSEVAALLGFSGGSRFAHWFQQRFGCSATQWRARQRLAHSAPI